MGNITKLSGKMETLGSISNHQPPPGGLAPGRGEMKFQLCTTETFYPKKEERKGLKKLGFSFERWEEEKGSEFEYCIKGNPEIELHSLEALIKFSRSQGRLIMIKALKDNEMPIIVIINSYLG